LGGSEVLIGRLSKPAHRNRIVPCNTLSLVVLDPEIELSIGRNVRSPAAPQKQDETHDLFVLLGLVGIDVIEATCRLS